MIEISSSGKTYQNQIFFKYFETYKQNLRNFARDQELEPQTSYVEIETSITY